MSELDGTPQLFWTGLLQIDIGELAAGLDENEAFDRIIPFERLLE